MTRGSAEAASPGGFNSRHLHSSDNKTAGIGRLAQGSKELAATPVNMDNFLTAIVQSLNWDYRAHIRSIDTVQCRP